MIAVVILSIEGFIISGNSVLFILDSIIQYHKFIENIKKLESRKLPLRHLRRYNFYKVDLPTVIISAFPF